MEKMFQLWFVCSFVLLFVSSNAAPQYVCDSARFANMGLHMVDFSYCDKSLPYAVRAKDLVGRMTLTEKVAQTGDKATGVERLGLPEYKWWSEALHGVSNVGPGTYFDWSIPGATSFPNVISTAASFNQSMWRKIGKAVSTEARGMYNEGRSGLTYWSPNINVVRDPRWGRTLETPGEDPFVVGTYAVNYVRGLQDVEGTENATDLNSRPLKVSACCKHYTAYDIDAWLGVDRYHFDSRVASQDMEETFQRPFEMCVKEGDVSSVMCSYNRVNGIPTCADPRLLKQKIRGEWDLHGYIVSDCDSLEVMVDGHKWLGDTGVDAASQALKAGLDLDCGSYYTDNLEQAVTIGQVREREIDTALENLYVVLMRVGFFDGNPAYDTLGKQSVCSEDHIELATEAAREGIVLLKNDDQILPLSSNKVKNLAVIGPHANATYAMIGNYAGIPCRIIPPLYGLSMMANVTYAKGCSDIACKNDKMIFEGIKAAQNADATILFVGLDLSFEAESNDRVNLLLPGYQTQLINQVAEAASGPVILVILSAGGLDISFAKKNPKIKAILWAGYPGEEGGAAIADVIYGKYNPGGRLPVTWYEADYVNQLPMTSLKLRPDNELGYPGRTYKFFTGPTVYPFGYGLSYTQFKYDLASTKKIHSVNIKLNKHQLCRHVNYTQYTEGVSGDIACNAVLVDDLNCNHKFGFKFLVNNVGTVDGSEVVMVYSKPPESIDGTHIKQVIGFEKVNVAAGKSQEVKFVFDVCKSLAIVDATAYKIVPSGIHTIMLGDSGASILVKVNYIH